MERNRFLLPDFCTGRNIATVMVIAQLTALLLILARPVEGAAFWVDLLRVSLFLHWIALCSAAVMCLARGWLATLRPVVAVGVALALLVAVAAALAEAAWWMAGWSGLGDLVPAQRAEFILRTLGVSAVIGTVVLRYLWVRNEWRRRVETEAAARFTALQARIRPHFLFNSMNTIAALTRTDAASAEQAVEDLADLFRVSLAGPAQRVTLGDELDICRRYLRIETLRLGDRLRVRWDTGVLPLDARVPGLLLQPLLENAVYHGVEPCDGAAEIAITGRVDGSTIEIEIRNPLPDPDATARRGNRLALDNVEERLELAFERSGSLSARVEGDAFIVTLRFPYERQDAPVDR